MDSFSSLPDEIVIKILEFINLELLFNIFSLNKDFLRFSAMEELWYNLCKVHGVNVKEKEEDISYRSLLKENYFHNPGDVYSWGLGALGHGWIRDKGEPKVIWKLLMRDVKKVFCGGNGCSVLLRNGKVLVWGNNEKGQLGLEEKQYSSPQILDLDVFEGRSIRHITHGESVTLFLCWDGSVWMCGDNSTEDKGGEVSKRTKPILITSRDNEKMVRIASGSNHFGCIGKSGVLNTFGDGLHGKLGHGSTEGPVSMEIANNDDMKLRIVESLRGIRIVEMAFGRFHSMVLSEDGTVFSFGDCSFGQLGYPVENREKSISIPKPVSFFVKKRIRITQISAGSCHSGAIDEHGNCYIWGCGVYGQIGDGEKFDKNKICHSPVLISRYQESVSNIVTLKIPEIHRFKQLSCGDNHCIALLEKTSEEELERTRSKRVVLTWPGKGISTTDVKGKEISIPTELVFFNNKLVKEVHSGGHVLMTLNSHQWIPHEDVDFCMDCSGRFNKFRRRKHHCWNCFGIFCNSCSRKKIVLKEFGFKRELRVCNYCFSYLNN